MFASSHGPIAGARYFATIAFVALCLLALGYLGIQRGDELELAGSYASKQFLWGAIGVTVLALSLVMPYRSIREWSYVLYACCLVLLIVVFFLPARNGARRWIPLGPMFLQPSELAKLAYIFAISHYLMFRSNQRTALGLIPPFLMTLIPVLLILKEPDLGTSLLFFPALYAILFAAGAKRTHLVLTLCAGIMVAPVLWKFMSAEQKSRVTALFLQSDSGELQTGDGYHLHQSKMMLAHGGAWGQASVDSMADLPAAAYRLPAGRTDFVYCLVGERLGLPGTLGVLGLFALLIWTGLGVAAKTRDPFGRLVATGLVTMLGSQALINTAMTVGLAPITGLTLPLMSYGGSSLLMTLFSLGILMNIAIRPGYDLAGQPFQFHD